MVLFTRDPKLRTFIQSEEALVVDGFTETVHWASKTPGRSFDLETSLNSIHGLTHCYLSHSTETKSRRNVGEQRRPVQLLSFLGNCISMHSIETRVLCHCLPSGDKVVPGDDFFWFGLRHVVDVAYVVDGWSGGGW